MNRLERIFAVILLICCLAGGTASADIPIIFGRVQIASGDQPVTLLIVPDGSGPPVTQVRTETGEVLDGTITLTLLDGSGIPVFHFPAEDIWLESRDGGMALCFYYGTHPDSDTDVNGQTTWTGPLYAGGWSEDLMLVYVNGAPVWYDEENSQLVAVNLQVNSPDVNGSRNVDLVDVTQFAGDFFGNYIFRSDLHRDGTINLLDAVVLVRAWGRTCP